MRLHVLFTVIVAALLFRLCNETYGSTGVSPNYVLLASAQDNAGGSSTSTTSRLWSAIGQLGSGISTSSAYRLKAGFVQLATSYFASNQYFSLTIQSPHGTASPAAGSYLYLIGTTLTNQIAAPPDWGTTQYACSGWTMANHNPATGSNTSLVMSITNNAILTWTWQTNFWLDAKAGTNGSINMAAHWQPLGSSTQILATAAQYYQFTNWTGTVLTPNLYSNPLAIVMSGPKAVTANFVAVTTTNGTPHWWLARYGLAASETGDSYEEGDGHAAWAEYIAGTDPTNAGSAMKITQVTTDGSSGIVTLRWISVPGKVYRIEYSTNLAYAVYNTVTSSLTASSSTNSWVGVPPTFAPQYFYRVSVSNCP